MTGICPTSCTYFCISFLAMSLGLFEVAEKQDWQGTTTRDPDFLREVPGGFCFDFGVKEGFIPNYQETSQ